ncbi:hypothetical protein D3C85_1552100 [compost metagenome]
MRMEPAIIIPGVICPSITNNAPSPNTNDCKHRRKDLLIAVITADVSLAWFCSVRKRACKLNQRLRKVPSMPMAWMLSALCNWLSARWVDCC